MGGLKALCREAQLVEGGNKETLMSRLREYMEDNPNVRFNGKGFERFIVDREEPQVIFNLEPELPRNAARPSMDQEEVHQQAMNKDNEGAIQEQGRSNTEGDLRRNRHVSVQDTERVVTTDQLNQRLRDINNTILSSTSQVVNDILDDFKFNSVDTSKNRYPDRVMRYPETQRQYERFLRLARSVDSLKSKTLDDKTREELRKIQDQVEEWGGSIWVRDEYGTLASQMMDSMDKGSYLEEYEKKFAPHRKQFLKDARIYRDNDQWDNYHGQPPSNYFNS